MIINNIIMQILCSFILIFRYRYQVIPDIFIKNIISCLLPRVLNRSTKVEHVNLIH